MYINHHKNTLFIKKKKKKQREEKKGNLKFENRRKIRDVSSFYCY
jgi:hypothetical protein